jgi:hypothetical protein
MQFRLRSNRRRQVNIATMTEDDPERTSGVIVTLPIRYESLASATFVYEFMA